MSESIGRYMATDLKVMNKEELALLFKDINDLEQVEFIGRIAFAYVALNKISKNELNFDEDALEVDNARRARELKA